MIYDCFTFFNELELLDVRLNILNDVVDKFVLVEMGKTHMGDDKTFIFDDNKEKFSKFLDKIIHVKVDKYPELLNSEEDCDGNKWILENYQRDQIMQGLKDAHDNDIILISDLDEIPNPECIKKYDKGIKILEQKNFYYFLNYLNISDPILKWGTKICHYSDLKDPKMELPPNPRYSYTKYGYPTYLRCCLEAHGAELVPNGGWHFSFVMDIDKMILKRQSIVEQQYNTEENMSYDYIKRMIEKGKDLFSRPYEYEAIKIDKSYPEYIRKNQDKYSKLIYSITPSYKIKKFLRHFVKDTKTFMKKIFSIRNYYKGNSKYKILNILFFKITFKVKQKKKQLLEFINYCLNSQLDKSRFIEITKTPFKRKPDSPKLLAFYLPQYHSFPENDNWFGRGFTEWTNVTKAVPQYKNHYQPHLPIDVGYYNLETTHAMKRQIELAKMYGIYGFSFYYYWFSGKKLMDKPTKAFLEDKTLDLPFCIFWTNENWSRLWGGGEMNEVLYKQEIKDGDSIKFMDDFLPYIQDERYIKINNKPLLIILNLKLYDTKIFRNFIKEIREIAKNSGFEDLYITTIRRADMDKKNLNHYVKFYGLDGLIEFVPGDLLNEFTITKPKNPIMNDLYKGIIFDTEKYVESEDYIFESNTKIYKGLFPSWDNTPRKNYSGSIIFENTSPSLYKKWLKNLINWTKIHYKEYDDQIIFINAWNEWAEGAHLEPDQKYGYAYLQATKEALEETGG